jgi:hypothetical protein
MKVHRLKVGRKYQEYMCLIELSGEKCQSCYIEKQKTGKINIVESKLKAPKNIESKCKFCDTKLVNFFDLPNEQKRKLEGKYELPYLVQNIIYCPSCEQAYSYNPSSKTKR